MKTRMTSYKSISRFESAMAFIVIAIVIFLFFTSCGGGGGSSSAPLSRSIAGVHVNPVLYVPVEGAALPSWMEIAKPLIESPTDAARARDQYMFDYYNNKSVSEATPPLRAVFPDPMDYGRIKRFGSWIVMNFFKFWYDDPNLRDGMLYQVDAAKFADLRVVIRLEDNAAYSSWPEPVATDAEWESETWQPYVRGVVEYCRDRGGVYGFQIWNETQEPSRYMVGPSGEQITAADYVSFLARTRAFIHEIDPEARVIMAAVTSITETDYYDYLRSLLGLHIHPFTDAINIHEYMDGGYDFFEAGNIERLRGACRWMDPETGIVYDPPWIVTETNHIRPDATATMKWTILNEIWNLIAGSGRVPEGFMIFCWESDWFLPAGWSVKGTELEEIFLREWGGGS